MANHMSDSSTAAGELTKTGLGSLIAGYFSGCRTHREECEPVSDREFKLLMAFVVLATFTFGCVVHGWLL